MDRKVMKEEAVKRMRMLHILPRAVDEFNRQDKINLSENGILFWLDEEQEKMVREWEADTGNVVYHVIHNMTEVGEMYALLFVSKYQEEWWMDNESIPGGTMFAYVINKDEPLFSEYGSIGVRPFIGGVLRTA